MAGTVAVLAVLAGVAGLLSGMLPRLAGVEHAGIAAAPLLLIGLAYVALQVLVPSDSRTCVRHLGIAFAFLLWGIDTLLPPGVLAETIGHLVILLYVVDPALTVRDQLSPRRRT